MGTLEQALLIPGMGRRGPSSYFALRTSAATSIGSQSLSFTRATTACVTDHEGIIRTALSGELRFNRARRVRNLIPTKSEDLTNAAWTASTATKNSATNVTFSGAGASVQSTTLSTGGSLPYVISFKVRGTAANTLNVFFMDTASGTKGGGLKVTLTADYVRYSFAVTLGAATESYRLYIDSRNFFALGTATNSQTFDITEIQVEDVTGQSNTNPSEYVSVGVLSSPFHGAFVDGVKYFDTANGNSVASNVVTEATGAALTDSDSDPIGALCEPAGTNLCTYSEQMDDAAWSKSACTASANAVASPSGLTTAEKLVEDTATAVHRFRKNLNHTSGTVYTWSVFAKAAERSWLYMEGQVGTCYFNLGTGAIGTATSCTGYIEAFGNGWYRCSIVYTASSTAASNHDCASSTGNGGASYLGDGASGIYLWGAQHTASSVPSSYIPTTTASVTRNADALTAPLAVYSDTQGTVSIEAQTAYQSASSNHRLVGSSGFIYQSSSPLLRYFDGTNNTGINPASIASRKTIATAWGGSTARIAATGLTATSGSYDGGWGGSGSVPIGRSISDTTAVPVVIRNLKFWSRKLTDAEQNAVVGN